MKPWDAEYFDAMKLCFTAVEFTHLTLNCSGLLLEMLIDIIRSLPHLLSLQLSSWNNLHLQNLSFEDSEMLLLVSINSKITKVKVNQIRTSEHLQLLINLCPRIQYLAVGYTTNNDLEKMIRYIALNNETRALYLSHLCVCVNRFNEEMVRSLHEMIGFERLFQLESNTFRNYRIQHRDKRVLLDWDLS